MAQLMVFTDHANISGRWILGSGARFDGTVRKFDPPKGRYPRQALWSFGSTGEGDWGLLTIADDTQKLCETMWSDPLMATEYSYIARATPEYQV